MNIYLDYYKANIVDRDKFFKKYSLEKTDVNGVPFRVIQPYKMLQGTPLLVNVEGSYINANDIPELLVSRKYSKQVNDWLQELRNPTNAGGEILDFVWKR